MAHEAQRIRREGGAGGGGAGHIRGDRPGPGIDQGRRTAPAHPISGPLATATVSFGAWAQTPAPGGDRHPNLGAAAGLANNVHALIPNEVKIKAGGTVNYIIAGFHQVIVYDDGMTPADIDISLLIPGLPPLIDDPNRRVYRGISPGILPLLQGPLQQGPIGPPAQPVLQDRVEVVHFPNPGTFPGDLRRAAALRRRNGWLRPGHSVVMLAG